MTPEEAIRIIEVGKAEREWNAPLEYQEAFDVAIEALEKQIPVKIGSKVMDYMGRVRPECGNCGEIVEDAMWSYCPWCGQKIGEEL